MEWTEFNAQKGEGGKEMKRIIVVLTVLLMGFL